MHRLEERARSLGLAAYRDGPDRWEIVRPLYVLAACLSESEAFTWLEHHERIYAEELSSPGDDISAALAVELANAQMSCDRPECRGNETVLRAAVQALKDLLQACDTYLPSVPAAVDRELRQAQRALNALFASIMAERKGPCKKG